VHRAESFSAASRKPSTSDSLATSQCTPITVDRATHLLKLCVVGAVSMSPTRSSAAFENWNRGGEADALPSGDHGCLPFSSIARPHSSVLRNDDRRKSSRIVETASATW